MSASIFLHCGLHKTASSAIQMLCATHRAQLADMGVLYPETGDAELGHHNLAWEITGDSRFRADALTLQTLAAQITAFPGDVVLSSEDFEGILHRQDRLSAFVRTLGATGKPVRLIVYIRNKRDYVESLYLELLKHGYAEPFSVFAASCRGDRLDYRDWTFHLDPRRVLAALENRCGIAVIRRRYAGDVPPGAAVTDFLSVIGVRAEPFAESVCRIINQRKTPAESLTQFCETRLGRALEPAERLAIDAAADGVVLRGRFDAFFSLRQVERVLSARDLGGVRKGRKGLLFREKEAKSFWARCRCSHT